MYAQWVAKDPLMWMSIFKPRFDKTYDIPDQTNFQNNHTFIVKKVLFEFISGEPFFTKTTNKEKPKDMNIC